jgi:uncharacterized protein (TIGR02246 family)
MKQFTLPALMVAFVILLNSCQNNSKENTAQQKVAGFNLDSAKKSIDEQNAAFQKAFENSDSVGLANLFTSDGKMMMPGAPSIVGRPAIKSTIAMFMKMNIKRQAKTINVWGNDDLLVEEGTASLSDQKGAELEHAKYLVIWKKEDGQWKLFRDMWNTDLAPKSSK